MEDKRLAELTNSIFNVSNGGTYAPAFSAYETEVYGAFVALGDYVVEHVEALLTSNLATVKDFTSEKTAQFLLSSVSENWDDDRLSQRRMAFHGELALMQPLCDVASFLDSPLASGDFWLALIHFESPEERPPFTTDYLLCDNSLRYRFVVHACLDFALPARQIPASLIDYAVSRMDRLNEICWVVREHQNLSVKLINEVLDSPSSSLSSGLL